jgi:glucose-1-phosphate cytidylyltransferase
LRTRGDVVEGFVEKPPGEGGLVNGGFFVLSPKCLELIEGDDTAWEQQPLHALASAGQLMAFEHDGFWQPMDALREKVLLEELWQSGKAPWKVWK